MVTRPESDSVRAFRDRVRARHPGFVEAVMADLRITASLRGDRVEVGTRFDAVRTAIHLAAVSDAFGAQVCYRAKASLQARGVPVLPRVFHRLAMMLAQVCIGDPVVVEAGVYLAHGQVVIDGIAEVGSGTVFFPWVTVGLKAGNVDGPKIGRNVRVGTGAKIIGPVRVGDGATIGANAVVVTDVAPGATVAGIPARPLAG